MPLKTSDVKQDLILKVFDYFEAESKLSLGESEMNISYMPGLRRHTQIRQSHDSEMQIKSHVLLPLSTPEAGNNKHTNSLCTHPHPAQTPNTETQWATPWKTVSKL